MTRLVIVDAHLDIAWNKVALGREFSDSALDKRRKEGPNPAHGEGSAIVGLPELLEGNIRVVFSTIYVAKERPDRTGWGRTYANPHEAHEQGLEELEYYRACAQDPRVQLIEKRSDLEAVLESKEPRVGLVLLMEGADPIETPEQTLEWYRQGVRLVGPAWRDTRYSGGTLSPGGLTSLGRELMPQMQAAGMILDTSHMAEQSFFEALELFHGTVVASHSNSRTIIDTDRQLSDEMARSIIGRDGVIGCVLYNRFLMPGWEKTAAKDKVSLRAALEHIDHFCEIAGDASHVGIGSDFDGGFGKESVPSEIDTIADLQRLGDVLTSRFSDSDVINILGDNWIRLLRRALPAG